MEQFVSFKTHSGITTINLSLVSTCSLHPSKGLEITVGSGITDFADHYKVKIGKYVVHNEGLIISKEYFESMLES